MTHNKLFSVIIVSAVVTLASILYIVADKKQYDYLNDNIEALAAVESGMKISCDLRSIIIFCRYSCICGTVFTTDEGYGVGTGLKGICPVCKRQY